MEGQKPTQAEIKAIKNAKDKIIKQGQIVTK